MKTEPLLIAGIVLAAVFAGAGITYVIMERRPAPLIAPATPAHSPPPIGTSSITPPLTAQPRTVPTPEILGEVDLDAAIEKARLARANGSLPPIATTPESLARALGAVNYKLHTLAKTPPPPESDPAFIARAQALDAVTAELARVLCEDALFEKLDAESPAQLARVQAHIAAGSLDLDEAATGRLEAMLTAAYAETLPPTLTDEIKPDSPEAAAFDEKYTAMMATLQTRIGELLTPAQRERFESLGIDQSLNGLADPDPEPEP